MVSKLTTVRAINAAIHQATMGKGGYVFCELEGTKRRITQARIVKGQLQVRLLSAGPTTWATPTNVWHE